MQMRQEDHKKSRHLSFDDVNLFKRALTALEASTDSNDLQDFFATIEPDLRGKEILIARDKTCSRFLEKYIQKCPILSLQHLMVVFSGHFNELAMDRFASHSMEKLILQCSEYIDMEVEPSFRSLLAGFITELTPTAGELAEDNSGSHVVRLALSHLSLFDSFVQKIDKLCRKIVQYLIGKPSALKRGQFSATLQEMARLDQEKYGKLLKYLVSSIPFNWDLISDKSGSRIAECLVQTIGNEVNTALFDFVFKDSVIDATKHGVANFVFQKWIEYNIDDSQIQYVADILIDNAHELMYVRPQVFVSLAARLAKCNDEYQERFVNKLKEEAGNDPLVLFLHAFMPPSGAQIAQFLCSFGKAARDFVEQIKVMDVDKLVTLALDIASSHVISDFVRSTTIDQHAKNRLVKRLLPEMKTLAAGQFGQYVVQAIFQSTDLRTKATICEAINSDDIRRSQPGLWRDLHMDQFQSRRSQWEKSIESASKREKVMTKFVRIAEKDEIDFEPIRPQVQEPTESLVEATSRITEDLGVLQKKRKRKHHNV